MAPIASPTGELAQLRAQNARLQAEVERLKAAAAAGEQRGAPGASTSANGTAASLPSWDGLHHGLTKEQIGRYSRQIVLHSFGVQGAMKTHAQTH